MKTIRFILLTCFFLLVNDLFGSPFDMILTGDPVLEDLRVLSLESGKPFLSFTPPLSPAELRNFIDTIDESALSQPATEAYYRVLKRLQPQTPLSFSQGIFTGFLNVNAALEGKVRFNSDISWYPRYPKITPFLSFPLRLSFADYVQLYIEPNIAVKPARYGEGIGDVNIPLDVYHFTAPYLPWRAFAAAGGPWWNFQLGRDRLYWGTSQTGSLTFSDNFPYFDFARLSLFSSSVKYSIIVNQLPLELSSDLFPLPGEPAYPGGWDDPENLRRTTQRYYYLHRLDFSLFNRVSIGIMEGLMVGNSPIEIRYLNPLVIFHSLFSWRDYDKWEPAARDNPGRGDMNGSFLSLEINWNIIEPLSFYGQFSMNEFALPAELNDQPNQPPNAFGFIAGLQLTKAFNTWGSVFFLEFIYTDPYLSILSTPFASFIHVDDQGKYFIGYPRDTIAVTLGTRFFNRDTLSFSGRFSWISSGEHNRDELKWDWRMSPETRNERTPSGTAENKLVLSLAAQWKPFSYLSLKGEITGIVSLNNNHNPGINETGGQASLCVGFHY